MIDHDIGRVISRFGAELILETQNDGNIRCTTRRKLEHVACGDFVRWQKEAQGNASVLEIMPRTNVLSRPDFRGKMRSVAANVDLLLLVSSWLPAPNWEMLDRYLVAAKQLPADVLIIMNKADLRAECATPEQEAALEEYSAIGYPVVHANADNGAGIDAIQQAIGSATAVLAGQSGVGKSSLVAQLLPEQDVRVGAIGGTGEGRHTTTVATLYPIGDGALIDSPGVRDFALPPLDLQQLQSGYPEFAQLESGCKFNNCTHQHEPGCGVKAAVANQELPPQRYQRYLTQLASQTIN